MKKNYSVPKLNSIEIANRLNILKNRYKPRLQFPTHIESKKHYFEQHTDKVVISLPSQPNQNSRVGIQPRNNLDISDIDGTKPKLIEKQKNIMNFYGNVKNHEESNPFASDHTPQPRIGKSYSESKISQYQKQHDKYSIGNMKRVTDSLDTLGSLDTLERHLHRKMITNPELSPHQRVSTETDAYIDQKNEIRSLIIERKGVSNKNQFDLGGKGISGFKDHKNMGIRGNVNPNERKSLIFNPTFMSSISLL